MSGKNKKSGKKVMSLGEFQNMGNEGAEAKEQVVVRTWAETMDEQDQGDEQTPAYTVIDRSMLPKAPKSVMGPDIDFNLLPKEKPFRAHLSNISYEADETSLKNFFKDSKIEGIYLSRTDRGNGHKGFGSIEFEDRESLITALSKNELPLHARPIKITLKEYNRDGFDNRGNRPSDRGGDDRHNKSDLDTDWRKREPNAEEEHSNDNFDGNNQRREFYQHDQRNYQNRGYRNRNNNQQQQQQQQQNESSGGVGNWNDRRNNRNRQNYQPRQQNDENTDRSGSGRYSGGRGGYRQYNQHQHQHQKHHHDQHDHHDHHEQHEQQHVESNEQPNEAETIKERPKINLQPRTKPLETPENNESASTIFGGAKPVDTAARERAIEEKLKAAAETAKQNEKEKEENKSVHEDNVETKSTTSVEHTHSQKQYHDRDHKQHRGDQKFYSAKGTKQHRNYQDGNQMYESSDPLSPPPSQQQQQQQQQYHHNENRNRSNQQQHQRRSNYQQNEHQNQNRQPAHRPASEVASAPSTQTRTPQKETIEAPPPAVNAWSKGVGNLFKGTPQEDVPVQQQQQQQQPQQQQQQPQPASSSQQPQQQQLNNNDNNNNNNNRNNNYKNSNRTKQFNNSNNQSNRSFNKDRNNRRYNDNNNNNTENNNNKKQFNKKGDRNDNRRGGDERGYAQKAYQQPQQQQQEGEDDREFSNKFSKLLVEDGLDEE